MATISAFGVGASLYMPNYVAGYYAMWGYYWTVDTLTMAAATILDGLALSGLFKRQKKGWQFLFYGSLVNIAGQLLLLNILSAIISAAISLYILFQIREYYNK